MSHRGLILDFGGVVTTDLFAELSAFCVREGLDPDAFVRVLHDDPEGIEAFAAVEAGKIPQREFEITIGRLLGVDDHGQELGMATVHFTDSGTGVSEISRLLGLF
jgi:putative hydrolase of the HAD superfamily